MISVKHLTKYYGEHLAVDDISFEIKEGHVYGFLGPNGAGKSTTMNIITGCLSATDGTVLIDGHDIYEEPNEAKKLIGYLPEHPPLYMNESPLEFLKYVGEAKGLRGPQLRTQINEVIEKTGISNVKNRRISELSKGYKQRVGIAQALLGNPQVIILDEPTVGLDPIQIIEIRELITELGKTHTVIFSSHILTEVQAICDQIVMIVGGKLVAFGEPEELQKQLLESNEILLTTNATESEIQKLLSNNEQITEIEIEGNESGFTIAHIKSEHDDIYDLSASVFRAFAASEKIIYEMSLKKGNQEEIFIELSETADAQALQDETEETPEESEVDTIRATDSETRILKEKAQFCNLNLSTYMVEMGIKGIIVIQDLQTLSVLATEINKIGVNINQIAHKINYNDAAVVEDMENIKLKMNDINALMREVIDQSIIK